MPKWEINAQLKVIVMHWWERDQSTLGAQIPYFLNPKGGMIKHRIQIYFLSPQPTFVPPPFQCSSNILVMRTKHELQIKLVDLRVESRSSQPCTTCVYTVYLVLYAVYVIVVVLGRIIYQRLKRNAPRPLLVVAENNVPGGEWTIRWMNTFFSFTVWLLGIKFHATIMITSALYLFTPFGIRT